jgi:hypothetical protein
MRIEWRRDEPTDVITAADLDAALDAVESDTRRTGPALGFLKGIDGFLTVGLGHPTRSILMYGSLAATQTALHAIGDERARAANDDQPFLTFSFYGPSYDFATRMG